MLKATGGEDWKVNLTPLNFGFTVSNTTYTVDKNSNKFPKFYC